MKEDNYSINGFKLIGDIFYNFKNKNEKHYNCNYFIYIFKKRKKF